MPTADPRVPRLSRALVGALAITGLSAALGAGHSLLVPIRLTRLAPASVPLADPASEQASDQAQTTTGEGEEPIATINDPDPIAEPPAAHQGEGYLSLEDAKARFDDFATFIDARKLEEYEAGHIEGAFWMPADQVGSRFFLLFDAGVQPSDPIVIYCVGGECDASENVAIRLEDAGFTNLLIMADGYDDWAGAGHPTAAGAPEDG